MDEAERRPGGLSPIKVFLALAALLIAGFATYFLTRDTGTHPTQTIDRQPAASVPTEAEATSLVRDLQLTAFHAYEDRDISMVGGFALEGSTYAQIVTSEIEQLIDDGVIADFRYELSNLSAVSITPSKIVVTGDVLADAVFFDEDGHRLQQHRTPELRTTEWTLVRVASQWWIEEALVTQVEERSQ